MLLPEHRKYLLSRSYTDRLIAQEEVLSLETGYQFPEGIEIRVEDPLIAWVSRSMSGQLNGIQTRRTDRSEYRWFQAPKAGHLPIIYGTEEDYDLLFRSRRMMLCEGIMDRAALKRCLPDYAIFARLSKGASKHLLRMILRYADTLWTAFDQDGPGIKATLDTEKRLSGKLEIHQLEIPTKDPSKLIESRGESRAKEIIERQIRSLEW